jgi:MFS transporter, putative metabolite:H+ symporter
MIIVTFGALGAVVAGLVGKNFGWQTTYIIGGCMGLALLLLRAGIFESSMYSNVAANKTVKRGNLALLIRNKTSFMKYLACIAIGLTVWFVIGVLVNLSNRFGSENGLDISVADCVMFAYLGLSAGDLLSGLLSQLLKSRKKVVFAYVTTCLLLSLIYLFADLNSVLAYKVISFLLGAATGYWALFVTIASEQFGTNIRSTVTNTVPNFVRGAVVPITLSFKWLTNSYSIATSACIVGIICCVLAFISTYYLEESFDKDLNYTE